MSNKSLARILELRKKVNELETSRAVAKASLETVQGQIAKIETEIVAEGLTVQSLPEAIKQLETEIAEMTKNLDTMMEDINARLQS